MKNIFVFAIASPIVFYILSLILILLTFDEISSFFITLSIYLGVIIGFLYKIYKNIKYFNLIFYNRFDVVTMK